MWAGRRRTGRSGRAGEIGQVPRGFVGEQATLKAATPQSGPMAAKRAAGVAKPSWTAFRKRRYIN